MVFSSITFLLYFLPVSLVGYYLISAADFLFRKLRQLFCRLRKKEYKKPDAVNRLLNLWLLVVSLFFYAWGEPVFVIIMLAAIVVNWGCGLLIAANENKKNLKKLFMLVAVVADVALLCVFKYTNFIVDTVYSIAGFEPLLKVPKIALPIGISFFTFQAISYVVDVYRNDAKVQKNLLDLCLYITFFPQLIAGPIVRYNTVAEQIHNRRTSFSKFSEGTVRFTIGMIKKVIISNNMAVIADNVFSISNAGSDIIAVPMTLAWLGAFAYLFQLYYDFSGYSDMAIGLGKIFGFDFDENFNHPLVAKSAREFMNRWHISLQTWFAEYVYYPLGGSRVKNDDLMVRNLFVVWLLTGIWHGAAWNFIWWGLGFFCVILIEKVTGFESWDIPSAIKRIYTILVVTVLMVLLRAESMHQFSEMFKNMFFMNNSGFFSDTAVMFLKEYALFFLAAIIFAMPTRTYIGRIFEYKGSTKLRYKLCEWAYVICLALGLLYCMIILAKGGNNPFIYFNF